MQMLWMMSECRRVLECCVQAICAIVQLCISGKAKAHMEIHEKVL